MAVYKVYIISNGLLLSSLYLKLRIVATQCSEEQS